MKHTKFGVLLAVLVAGGLALTGCATTGASASTQPINVTSASQVSKICGDDAQSAYEAFSEASNAPSDSGLHNQLTSWGVDPSDTKEIKQAKQDLAKRAATACDASDSSTASPSASGKADKADTKKRIDWDEVAKLLSEKKKDAQNTCVANDYSKTDDNGLYQYDPEFLKADLKYSDSYAKGFADTTSATKARDELYKANCTDPVQGITNATGFAVNVAPVLKKNSGGDVDLLKLQPWLKEFADSDIQSLLQKYDPLEFETDFNGKQLQQAQKATEQYQLVASKLNLLYSKYSVSWENAPKSTVNYHDASEGQGTNSAFPKIKPREKQEDLKALVFTLREKDVCEEIAKLGANAEDKRFELFNAKSYEDCNPKPKETKPKETKPETPNNPGTPSQPSTGCTTNCGTTYNPPPKNTCTTCTCLGTPCPKNPNDSVTPVQGADKQPAGPRQPVAPAAKPDPATGSTKPHTDTGTKVPVQGATQPSTQPSPAPSASHSQAPTTPGTPITDPDG